MVRSEGTHSNSISSTFCDHSVGESAPCPTFDGQDLDAVFDELERWQDVLKPHAHTLRGPRP